MVLVFVGVPNLHWQLFGPTGWVTRLKLAWTELSAWLTDWLTDWMTDWLDDWVAEWLTGWAIAACLYVGSKQMLHDSRLAFDVVAVVSP